MSFSEKEILLQYDRDFFVACLQLKKDNVSLTDLKTLMPEDALFNINCRKDLSLKYMCSAGEEFLDKDVERIVEGGAELIMDVTHPDSFTTLSEVFNYEKFGDPYRPFVRFQKVRASKKDPWTTVRTTLVKSKEHGGLLTMHNIIQNFKTTRSIKKHMDKEMEFVHQNYHKFYRLTEKEKQLLQLLGEGVRAVHIAEQMFTSYDNIRRQIKAINVKLELTKTTFNKAAIYAKYAIYFGL